ncbi:CACNA1F, partial [Symbiodinium microadriaticum]
MSEPMSDEGLLMQRQYKAQFQRLDKASNGRLEEEDLLAVMQSFYPGWELEDLPTVIHEVGRLHHHRLAVHHGRSSPGAVVGVKSYHESMDFDGFVALLSDDELIDGAETKGSVKRDVKILREALQAENNYNLYKDDGHWTQGSKKIPGPMGSMAVMVDVLPGIIIVINALVLGISSDFEEFHVVWQAFNIFFLAFYTLEFVVKVAMFGWKWFFLGEDWPWNYFDLFCVALSWVEEVTTWIVQSMNTNGEDIDLKAMQFIRMLRLTRLFRLVRTLRFEIFYELKMMVLGVVSGMRVLFWAMVLLIVIIYATGVAAKNMIGAVEPEFNTVPAAMFSIFRCFTDGCNAYDGTPLTERLRNNHGFLFI